MDSLRDAHEKLRAEVWSLYPDCTRSPEPLGFATVRERAARALGASELALVETRGILGSQLAQIKTGTWLDEFGAGLGRSALVTGLLPLPGPTCVAPDIPSSAKRKSGAPITMPAWTRSIALHLALVKLPTTHLSFPMAIVERRAGKLSKAARMLVGDSDTVAGGAGWIEIGRTERYDREGWARNSIAAIEFHKVFSILPDDAVRITVVDGAGGVIDAPRNQLRSFGWSEFTGVDAMQSWAPTTPGEEATAGRLQLELTLRACQHGGYLSVTSHASDLPPAMRSTPQCTFSLYRFPVPPSAALLHVVGAKDTTPVSGQIAEISAIEVMAESPFLMDVPMQLLPTFIARLQRRADSCRALLTEARAKSGASGDKSTMWKVRFYFYFVRRSILLFVRILLTI